MVSIEEYGEFETSWCPGCGNFPILEAVKQALVQLDLAGDQVCMVSGIGQAAKLPHYMKANMYNGLHGRALPTAQGVRFANPDLPVIVNSGDGCSYGEGGNHFISAIRRNMNLTMIVHDNQIYGLTKGQASPMTMEGHVTKSQPGGVMAAPFNPIAVAVGLKASFVARSFSGMKEHMVDMLTQAISHPGFALVDIMQPCVSFNKVNTFAWYKERCKPLGDEHDPTSWSAAMELSQEFGERIPVGIIYRNDRPSLESRVEALAHGPMVHKKRNTEELEKILAEFA